MSIGTYDELKTAVANWLDDTSLSSRVVEFVTMAESRINRDLGHLRAAWSNTTLTGTIDSRSVALPSDFVEAQALFLTTSGNQVELWPFVNGTTELRTASGTPIAWSINGTNIDLDCPCDAAHTFLFRYRAKWLLSDTATTNWLLTNNPDLYLSACLLEAYDYRNEPAQVARWDGKYRNIASDLEQHEARNLAIAPLRVSPDLLWRRPGVFDYSTGQ